MIATPNPAFTVVIPTYNERDRLGVLLERIFEACDRDALAIDVVVVDDNSADGTGALAEEWMRRRPVRVIHRAGKLGLGSAVLEGFAAARTDIVGVMDGDLSHPPELLPRLYRTLEDGQFDLAVASRYVPGGGTSNFKMGRWLLSRVGCWLARPLTPVHDAMSGFFLIRRSHLDGFRTSVSGFKIGLELFVRSQPRRLAEVGYVFAGRTVGDSKMSLGEGIGFLRQLAGLYRGALTEPVRRSACVTVSTNQERAASASLSGAERLRAAFHNEPPPSSAITTAPAAVLKPYEMIRSSAVIAAASGRSTPNASSPATRPPSTGPRPAIPGTRPPSMATIDSVAIFVGDSTTPNASVTHVRRRKSWSHNSEE